MPTEPSDPRFLWYRLVPLGFFALFAYLVFDATRKGRITPSQSDRSYGRTTDRLAFRVHVLAHLVVAMVFLAGVINLALTLLGFGVLAAYFAANSMKTGRTKPSNLDRVYTRSDDSGTFWFDVIIMAALAGALIAAAVRLA